eukprot:36150-Rhodomonas_salina.9
MIRPPACLPDVGASETTVAAVKSLKLSSGDEVAVRVPQNDCVDVTDTANRPTSKPVAGSTAVTSVLDCLGFGGDRVDGDLERVGRTEEVDREDQLGLPPERDEQVVDLLSVDAQRRVDELGDRYGLDSEEPRGAQDELEPVHVRERDHNLDQARGLDGWRGGRDQQQVAI